MSRKSAILVPIDYSQNSLNALAFAVEIAKRTGDALTVFHSYTFSVDPALGAPSPAYLNELSEERERDHVARQLEAVKPYEQAQYYDGSGEMDFRLEVRQGLPTDNIAAMAETGFYELVVMGTKGATGAREAIWGSIAYNVVEEVDIPVFVVPAEARFKGLRHIVYATDFDERDDASIRDLQALAETFASQLTCLHITTEEANLEGDRQRLDAMSERYRFTPVSQVNFELAQNESVERGLHSYLEEMGVDALAILPQHRGFVERLLHRSVTKRMAFHSKVPLLVLRHAE